MGKTYGFDMEQRGDFLKAEIIDIGDGRVLGACDDGRKIWLQGPAVPGDTVHAVIDRVRKNFATGRVTEIVSPRPDRLPAPCEHFQECPGCLLQPIPYEDECSFKDRKIRETLKRIGGITEFDWRGLVPSPTPYGYRNKLELTVRGHDMGYMFEDQMVPVADCMLGVDVIRKGLKLFQEIVKAHLPEDHGVRRVTFRASDETNSCVILMHGDIGKQLIALIRKRCEEMPWISGLAIQKRPGRPWLRLSGSGDIAMRLAGISHAVPYDSFFQVNREQADALIETAEEWSREFKPIQRALDLYCGMGAFTIPLADFIPEITGIDSMSSSVLSAKRHSGEHRHIGFIQHNLSKGLPAEVLNGKAIDFVIMDPPRGGVRPELVEDLIKLNPPAILYVSCNPSTLARDCRRLQESGNYRVTRAHGFDLFPRTAHVETIVLLEQDKG